MEEQQAITKADKEQLRLEFKAVINLADDNERVHRLIELAPDLPLDLLAESLTAISSLDDYYRTWFLTAAASSIGKDPELMKQALNMVNLIGNTMNKSSALGHLGVYAEEEQLPEILSSISMTGSDETRLHGWIPLADKLDAELKEQAFSASINTTDESLKVDAFKSFAHLFTNTWKKRAFASAKQMSSPYDQLDAMLALADNRTPIGQEVLNEAWKQIDASSDPQIRADFLPRIVAYIPSTEHERVIEQAQVAVSQIYDPQNRAETLLNMITYLPDYKENLFNLALDSIQDVTVDKRLDILYNLAPSAELPASISQRVGEMTRAIEDPDVRREAAAKMPQYFNIKQEPIIESGTEQFTTEQSAAKQSAAEESETDLISDKNGSLLQDESTLSAQAVSDNKRSNTPIDTIDIDDSGTADSEHSETTIVSSSAPWVSDSLAKILTYAFASSNGTEEITLSHLFSGLLAHAINSAEGSFAHGIYQNIMKKRSQLIQLDTFDISERMSAAGLSLPETNMPETEHRNTWNISTDVNDLLQKSRELVPALSDNGPLEDRHLWAAFLTGQDDNGWLKRLFKDNQINMEPMLDCTLTAIRDNVPSDNSSDWKYLLKPHQHNYAASSRLNKVVSDEPKGNDLLNLEREINAFAKTIAATDLQPPLAIGLFGDWGSGKSFFMEKVIEQIGDISEQVDSADNSNFCKHIAQIRFNAWNFVDSNLWASLITRVFDGLAEHMSRGTPHIVERKKGEIIAKLKRLQELENEANHELNIQKNKVSQAKSLETELSEKYQQSLQQLRSIRNESALTRIYKQTLNKLLQKRGELALKNINFEDKINNGKDLDDLVQQLQHGVSILQKIGVVDAQGKLNRNRLALIIITTTCLAGVGYLIDSLFMHFDTLFSTAAAGLLPVLAWLVKITKAFNQNASVICEVWQSEKAIKFKEEIEQEYQIQLEQASKNTRAQQKKLTDIQRDYEESSNRLKEMQSAAEQLDPNHMFAQFIEESAAKEEYRSRLGLISQISQDLKDLTDIFTASTNRWEGVNLQNSQPDAQYDNAAQLTPADNIATLEKLRRKPIDKIQRIVLYIDDLDRCPPKRVAEVLQAVHLLLAFKLFVVVVAVDPRWLHRALEAYYPEFLESTTHRPAFIGKEHKPRATTPRAYLEKIFQIPYVIPRMSATGYKLLIRNTAGEAAVTDKITETVKNAVQPENKNQEQLTNNIKSTNKNINNRQHRPDNTSTKSQTKIEDKTTPKQSEQNIIVASLDEVTHERLEMQSLETREIEFMEKLHPLIATPRATKRLVNIYKLIRVTIPDDELSDFIDSRATAAFRPVLLLLGIVIGFPEQAIELFSKIRQADNSQLLWDFINTIKPDSLAENADKGVANLSEAQYWQPVYTALNRVRNESRQSFNPGISRLKRHIARVERFSFEAALSTTNCNGENPN